MGTLALGSLSYNSCQRRTRTHCEQDALLTSVSLDHQRLLLHLLDKLAMCKDPRVSQATAGYQYMNVAERRFHGVPRLAFLTANGTGEREEYELFDQDPFIAAWAVAGSSRHQPSLDSPWPSFIQIRPCRQRGERDDPGLILVILAGLMELNTGTLGRPL
jgi:hypothetical protein